MHISNIPMQIRADRNLPSLTTGKKFSSASVAYTADQLGFTEVYTSPYSPHSNSMIERCHNFLMTSDYEIEMQL